MTEDIINAPDQLAIQRQELNASEQTHQVHRLANEFHDSLTQLLYSIALNTNSALFMLQDVSAASTLESLKKTLEDNLRLTDGGLSELQALFYELRPDLLDSEGLVNRLNRLAETMILRHSFQVQLRLCESEPELPPQTKLTLYRIAQEACFNIVKHSRAKQLKLDLDCHENKLVLEIADNGRGFAANGIYPSGIGLLLMQDLARRINATFTINSTPGNTYVRVETALR